MNAFLSKYLASILIGVIAVQQSLPTLKGESKKKLVIDLIGIGTGVAGTIPNEDVQHVSAGIDGAVKALQAAGVFGQDQVPVVATPPAST